MAGARTTDRLSPREAEVLRAVAQHRTNGEIAAALFISVRTVESHIAALLRKAGVADRRSLIAAAPDLLEPREPPHPGASTITSFVGRVAEREALAEALEHHRLVTALGPGGVGKTRLAQAVMAEVTDRYPDGAWYVDLVPITDAGNVAAAIAAALGVHERQGRSLAEGLASWLGARHLLLVLDNCEHLLDGVAALLEHLLLASPGLAVLATSRSRLAVPFEEVFPVPGLSTGAADGPGDAVRLFEARALSAGAVLPPGSRPRIAAMCEALDGMALAIELAAARLPAVGLDGLEAGLADPLALLAGGRRADDRHRSLRATLDWSYALLPPADQAVLRRVSVFAGPFSAAAAADVVADVEGRPAVVLGLLAELVDSSLLIATTGQRGTRYRALETIRQYGAERLAEAGETTPARAAHLGWCAAQAERLLPPGPDAGLWRAQVDEVLDDLRAALAWARGRADPAAFDLARRLGSVLFLRGQPAEAQRRLEQAAALAPDDRRAAEQLRAAAGAAEARQFGTESLRLRREAADAFLRAGDAPGAAVQVARAAEVINRGPGILVPRPGPEDARPLLEEAARLAGDDPAARSRVLTAEAFAASDDRRTTGEVADRAVEIAHGIGDPLGESAALDARCAVRLEGGDLPGATADALRRLTLIDTLLLQPEIGIELSDALAMSTECALGIGDLPLAGRLAERLSTLPYHRGEQHLATARGLLVDVLAGELARCTASAERFRDGWDRAGRPRVSSLSPSALAATAAYALQGDDASATRWREIAVALLTRPFRPGDFEVSYLEALVLLHRRRDESALRRLETEPEELGSWYAATWRPWYAAAWAEAAVLADPLRAPERIRRARPLTAPNPVATALLDRADALLSGDRAALPALADRLQALGSRYQHARTLLLAGGTAAERGAAAMAELGATA